MDFRCVAGSCGRVRARAHTRAGACDIHGPFGAVFVVAGIGGDIGDDGTDGFNAGVENNDAESLQAWRKQNRGCRNVMRSKFTMHDSLP